MQEGNKGLGMLKNVQFGREISTLNHVAYITVDFKQLVPLESKFIKRKTRLSEQPRNITIAWKHFRMQYKSPLQCISLTLHFKYPAQSLWDQCKLISEEVKKTTVSTKQ